MASLKTVSLKMKNRGGSNEGSQYMYMFSVRNEKKYLRIILNTPPPPLPGALVYSLYIIWLTLISVISCSSVQLPHLVLHFIGCGPPPAFSNINWDCERGYSDEVYSVYFPCKGRCNLTNEVHYHAYCNASLLWEITLDINSLCRGKLSLTL